ncbi:hypothetical protein LR48_Vigan09g050600 [Vigna angularis]|uniref:Uncharacterized protein n=1 Tax=Phaseolus angularis TaxID=3914 RepID=A0A0L9VA93_PHAAN|nr:hypothetical protein LR48_Vigan09g050600 [Vigna angularis]
MTNWVMSIFSSCTSVMDPCKLPGRYKCFRRGAHSAADLVETGEIIFEESIQVDSKLELPICLGEMQTSFDNLMHAEPEKPLPDILDVIPSCSEMLNLVFSVEHVDIPDVVYDVCTKLNHSFDDNIVPCIDLIDYVVVEPIAETDAFFIDHPKILDSVSTIEPIGINVVLNSNVHDCLDEILNDNSFELTFDSAEDAYVSIDFEIEIVQSENFIELGLNFDLTQFYENFKCDCESGSCSICTEINYVIQPELRVLANAPNFELDCCAELKEAKNAENTKQRARKEEGKEAMETLMKRVADHRRLKPISHFFTLLFPCSDSLGSTLAANEERTNFFLETNFERFATAQFRTLNDKFNHLERRFDQAQQRKEDNSSKKDSMETSDSE